MALSRRLKCWHEIALHLRPTSLEVATKDVEYIESEDMVDGEVVESMGEFATTDAAALVAFPSTPSLALDCQGSTATPGAGQKSKPCLAKVPRMIAKP
jgi:hypothetical protein